MKTGTNFLVFQSDLATKRAWLPIFFIAQFDVTHENALLCKIKKKFYVGVIYVFLTLNNNIEPRDVNEVRINNGYLQSDWTSALFYI